MENIMADTKKIMGWGEILSTLHEFKNTARSYWDNRKSDDAMNSRAMLMSGFNKALLATDLPQNTQTEIMKSITEPNISLLKNTNFDVNEILEMDFNSPLFKSVGDKTAELKKLCAEMKKYNKTLSADGPQEETGIVAELKKEIEAGIRAKARINGPQVTEELLEKLRNSTEIKCVNKKNGYTFLEYAPGEYIITAFKDKRFPDIKLPSRYGCLSMESVSKLKEKSSTKHKTASAKDDKAKLDAKKKSLEAFKKIKQKYMELLSLLTSELVLEDLAKANTNDSQLLSVYGDKTQELSQEITKNCCKSILSNQDFWMTYREDKDNRSNYFKAYTRVFANVPTQEYLKTFFEEYKSEKVGFYKGLTNCVVSVRKRLPADARIPDELILGHIFSETYKFGLKYNDHYLDKDKIEFMNRVLQEDGIHIAFEKMSVKNKIQAGNLKSVSEAIRYEKGNKSRSEETFMQTTDDKWAKVAMLYKIGEIAQKNSDRLDDLLENNKGDLICMFKLGKRDWDDDAKKLIDSGNDVYDAFNDIKEFGINPQDLFDKEKRGQLLNNSIIEYSSHHINYVRYAGLCGLNTNPDGSFNDSEVTDNLKREYNSSDNLITTLNIHPIFTDMHKNGEHKYDLGDTYIAQSASGQQRFATYNTIQVGEDVIIPVVMCEVDGVYERLMRKEGLFMTDLCSIMEPKSNEPNRGNVLEDARKKAKVIRKKALNKEFGGEGNSGL